LFNTIELHNAVAAVAPITGVSVADPNDKTTWVVHFQDGATQQQRRAARGVIDSWQPPA
jgi:hypothetical protein